jgi:hypothetical protein
MIIHILLKIKIYFFYLLFNINYNLIIIMLYDEIVIGAGISGLYWIYKSRPSNYLILEKSDRIGGRIYNINWNNKQISLGGGIIKHNNNSTIKLCEELGLELGKSTSEYEMIDWDENKNILEPNEKNFYKINENIIKYLKKVYNQHKSKIILNKYNFEEFLDLYVDLKLVNLIKSNILYHTYYNADVKSVLYDEMDELLRTGKFEIKYIVNGGYTKLLNELISIVGLENIKLNQNVIEIKKSNSIFEIKTISEQIFITKKIILATETKNNIKYIFEPNLVSMIENLYLMTSGSNYIRIYSYHSNGHGLKCSYKTSGLVGKVIYIDDKILMCVYTEELDAYKINKLLEHKTKSVQLEIIYNLLSKCNIQITKPDDIIIKYWNVGVHYNNPCYNKEIKNTLIKELKKENIIVVGECVYDSHGWVNSALESVESNLNDL